MAYCNTAASVTQLFKTTIQGSRDVPFTIDNSLEARCFNNWLSYNIEFSGSRGKNVTLFILQNFSVQYFLTMYVVQSFSQWTFRLVEDVESSIDASWKHPLVKVLLPMLRRTISLADNRRLRYRMNCRLTTAFVTVYPLLKVTLVTTWLQMYVGWMLR